MLTASLYMVWFILFYCGLSQWLKAHFHFVPISDVNSDFLTTNVLRLQSTFPRRPDESLVKFQYKFNISIQRLRGEAPTSVVFCHTNFVILFRGDIWMPVFMKRWDNFANYQNFPRFSSSLKNPCRVENFLDLRRFPWKWKRCKSRLNPG